MAPERIPHGQRFQSARLDICWAAAMELDIAEKCELLTELATKLEAERVRPHNLQHKIRAAIVSLRQVADILGHSPSQYEYRAIRQGLPELRLMADATIRRSLSGSWNECLQRALLEAVSDGDFVTPRLGHPFSVDEVLAGLAMYLDDNDGVVPLQKEFLAWARRPDVTGRPGRRPQSLTTFARLGGYWNLWKLLGYENSGRIDAQGRVIGWQASYTDDELLDKVRALARTLGRTPRPVDYDDYRNELRTRARGDTTVRIPPTLKTLYERWHHWKNVVAEAGLAELPSGRRPRLPVSRRPSYSDESLRESLLAAWAAVGVPFTCAAYDVWRMNQYRVAQEEGRHLHLPTSSTLLRRLGDRNWDRAVRSCLPSL